MAQVAVGRRPCLRVFGDDYPTPDGTGVRDYIHVVDLAQGHVRALSSLCEGPQYSVHNLGRGKGHSVKEVVRTFERVSGKPIRYEIVDRRPGDVAESYADPAKANQEFGWRADRTLETMCEDAWRWQSRNPCGFGRG